MYLYSKRMNGFAFKETVVLRQDGELEHENLLIKRVDKGPIATVKDNEVDVFSVSPSS